MKKLRVIAATLFMIAVTALSLDYTGAVHAYLGWCAKIQIVPALFAVNVAAAVGIVLVTLLFGRIYCSALCPLGIFLDIVSRLTHIGKKNYSPYRPPRKLFIIVRYSLLVLFIVAVVLHIPIVMVHLEPYSAYGLMVSQLFTPLYQLGNNVLAHFAERANSYAFYTVDVWLRSMPALIVAAVTFVVLSVFAWKSGRGYCNGVCPVGALLGLLSKFSVMKPRVGKGDCPGCGVCAKNCKAGCIDPVKREIDYTRCVVCFNCLKICPKGAVRYSASGGTKLLPAGAKAQPGTGVPSAANSCPSGAAELSGDKVVRRGLLAATALMLAGLVARPAANLFDGGLARLEPKRAPQNRRKIVPPGADSMKNFSVRCTGCQLCVTVCPNHVLRPSSKISVYLQPHMSFERGYCRPECVKCSQVCPTGAIRPITTAEKTSIQIGVAVWNPGLCIINRDNVKCDLCERKCPTGAIKRVTKFPESDDPDAQKIPMIDTARCTGCGACEHLCPSRPYSAIYVDGVDVHRAI